MPQATDELRALMTHWFGNFSEADWKCIQFLEARGWTENAGFWKKPTPSYNPSVYEYACIAFLIQEWDYAFETPLHPTLGGLYATIPRDDQ